MSSERGISPSAVVLAFLLGGALGSCLALLYAPESGKRTRDRLRRMAEDAQERTEEAVRDLRDTAEDRVRDWRDRVDEAVTAGKEFLEGKKDLLTDAYQAGKETFRREKRKFSSGDDEPAAAR